jgi:hypothetical protein
MPVSPFIFFRAGYHGRAGAGVDDDPGPGPSRRQAGARGELIAVIYDKLEVSVTTVEHDWRLACAWLTSQLRGWDV